jgi:hypothetical protein
LPNAVPVIQQLLGIRLLHVLLPLLAVILMYINIYMLLLLLLLMLMLTSGL